MAWKLDPFSQGRDAFQIQWRHLFAYGFPPFALIGQVLRKIRVEQASPLAKTVSTHTGTNFNYKAQQDAFEILQYVVDDLKDSSPIVNEILNCKVTSTITCNTCETSSTTEQKYDILSLPITDDINTCLSLSLQTETLIGDNSWFCPLCMELKESAKESQITQCGNILILHLKRYKNNGLGLAKDSRTVSLVRTKILLFQYQSRMKYLPQTPIN